MSGKKSTVEESLKTIFPKIAVYKDAGRNKFFSALGIPSYLRDWIIMRFADEYGKIDIDDARVILHYVNQLDKKYQNENSPLVGGAGIYSHHDFKGRVQSPYIHIDVRGFTNPDGSLIRWSVP